MNAIKRFLYFEFNEYYPSGGIYDCKLVTNSFNEMQDKIKTSDCYYICYYDVFDGKAFKYDRKNAKWVEIRIPFVFT